MYAAAIVGGSAGSFAMDVVQYTWARAFERNRPSGDQDEETEPAIVRGAMFGIVLWLISDQLLIPLFKLGRPWSLYSVSERSNALVSHLAYALIVEFARR
jgi:hypothetical protein